MIVGSLPTTPTETIRARGVRPWSCPACSLPITTSAAPSTMPDELPGECTWLIFSTQWYFCSATASKPPMSPMPAKDAGRPPSDSTVVPGRGNSSWSRIGRPLMSTTGITERENAPLAMAFAARSCDSAAKVSTSWRLKPSIVAIRSAPMPCGTKPVASAVSGSCAHAPPSEPIGTRDIDSTPPARMRSSQPERTFGAAMLTASRPDAQKRLSWKPAPEVS